MRAIKILGVAAVALTISATAAWAQAGNPCAELQAAAQTALGAKGTMQETAVSYVGQDVAPGCVITFKGTGAVFGPNVMGAAAKLDAMMTARGWKRDVNADADGPNETAGGYSKPGQLAPFDVSYDTPPGLCREDQPVASCRPTLVQKLYTITLGLGPGPQ